MQRAQFFFLFNFYSRFKRRARLEELSLPAGAKLLEVEPANPEQSRRAAFAKVPKASVGPFGRPCVQ